MYGAVDSIVVNYKTANDLDDFCTSYFESRILPGSTLTIVNNCPTDQDLKVTAKWDLPRVTVLNHDENIGYARAVNSAACRGDAEVIAIFNADVVLDENALRVCSRELMREPTWGVLGPRQVDSNNRITAAGIFGTNKQPKHRGWMQLDSVEYADVRDDAITVSGAALFARRSVWKELTACPIYRQAHPDAVGAFLPTLHFYEETWACYHAAAHGYKNVYYGPSCITHKWHQASPQGGSYVTESQPKSQAMFREMCQLHEIECD